MFVAGSWSRRAPDGCGGFIAPSVLKPGHSNGAHVDLTAPPVPLSSRPSFSDPARIGYNEPAFRYLLDVERRRARRAGRSLVLVLIRLPKASRDRGSAFPALRVLTGLSLSIREVDFCGWYREERVAAAVLTQAADAPSSATCGDIRDRVTRALASQLPRQARAMIQVRVVRLRPAPRRFGEGRLYDKR